MGRKADYSTLVETSVNVKLLAFDVQNGYRVEKNKSVVIKSKDSKLAA